MSEKVIVALSMRAERDGQITLTRIAFRVSKETPKMLYVGTPYNVKDNLETRKVINYKSQFRKVDLPERFNNNHDSTLIEFRIVDVCEGYPLVSKVMEIHTKELINKMEQELQKRKKLLDSWVSTVTE